jgi:hypothetical protein
MNYGTLTNAPSIPTTIAQPVRGQHGVIDFPADLFFNAFTDSERGCVSWHN